MRDRKMQFQALFLVRRQQQRAFSSCAMNTCESVAERCWAMCGIIVEGGLPKDVNYNNVGRFPSFYQYCSWFHTLHTDIVAHVQVRLTLVGFGLVKGYLSDPGLTLSNYFGCARDTACIWLHTCAYVLTASYSKIRVFLCVLFFLLRVRSY